MASWPATLPQKLRAAGFGSSFGRGAVRTDMDAGPAFQRQRFTASAHPVSGTLVLDTVQRDTLLAFWRDTLGMGALAFDWIDPHSEAAASLRFVAGSEPSFSALGAGLFEAQLTLEILP